MTLVIYIIVFSLVVGILGGILFYYKKPNPPSYGEYLINGKKYWKIKN